MEKQEESQAIENRRKLTEPYTVEIVPLKGIADVNITVLDVEPQQRPHEMTEEEERTTSPLKPIEAGTMGPSGTRAVDVHGAKKVEKTKTTDEQIEEAVVTGAANGKSTEKGSNPDSER